MVSGSISKLGSKGNRELNRLECSINYMMLNLRHFSHARGKERVIQFLMKSKILSWNVF